MNFPGVFPPTGGEFEYLIIGLFIGALLCEFFTHDLKARRSILFLLISIGGFFLFMMFVFWR